MTKAEVICILHVSIPADVECELLSAAFDPVLSLHVCHELCAVAVDSQNGVPWTQVTLGGLAAWCYLKVTFTRTYTRTYTHKCMRTQNPSKAKRKAKRKKRYKWGQTSRDIEVQKKKDQKRALVSEHQQRGQIQQKQLSSD